MSAVSIDIDDDVTSSLNTLLDTRPDSEGDDQRVMWSSSTPSGTTTSPHSPQSPTSVSSSVMSSDSGDRNKPALSQSEAISNISSPDYQEEDAEILNVRDLVMEVSDPSDSDSTLLLSETTSKVCRVNGHHLGANKSEAQGDHRIVIQVGNSSVYRMKYLYLIKQVLQFITKYIACMAPFWVPLMIIFYNNNIS